MPIVHSSSLFSPLNQCDQDFSIEIDEDHVYAPQLKTTWQGPLVSNVITAKRSGLTKPELMQHISEQGIEDFHWNWETIILGAPNGSQYDRKTFYLISNRRIQGVLHAFFPKPSKISIGSRLVYVDRVAVAPWNRNAYHLDKELKGVGSTLIKYVCSFSKSEGYGGCVGLHSLPQAESFYTRIGMSCLGEDADYDSLKYFEFTSQVGISFASGEVA